MSHPSIPPKSFTPPTHTVHLPHFLPAPFPHGSLDKLPTDLITCSLISFIFLPPPPPPILPLLCLACLPWADPTACPFHVDTQAAERDRGVCHCQFGIQDGGSRAAWPPLPAPSQGLFLFSSAVMSPHQPSFLSLSIFTSSYEQMTFFPIL